MYCQHELDSELDPNDPFAARDKAEHDKLLAIGRSFETKYVIFFLMFYTISIRNFVSDNWIDTKICTTQWKTLERDAFSSGKIYKVVYRAMQYYASHSDPQKKFNYALFWNTQF